MQFKISSVYLLMDKTTEKGIFTCTLVLKRGWPEFNISVESATTGPY